MVLSHSLVLIVQDVDLEGTRGQEGGVGIRGQRLGGRDPHVELRQPVL